MKPTGALLCLVALFATASRVSAALLYQLDFTSPEVGAYQPIFGHPTVQSTVGPFTDALVFHAVTSYEQIELRIGGVGPSYTIEFDVLAHGLRNSQYSFGVVLDTPEVRTVTLHGGLNSVHIFQPSPYTNADVLSFLDDQVYHFALSVDLESSAWSLAIDGRQVFTNPLDAAQLQSVRFSLLPSQGNATNAPATYVALDNVVVTSVPEPLTFSLLAAGAAAASFRRRRG